MTLHSAMRAVSTVLAALCGLCVAGVAAAQDYPTRTIQVIAGFPPGGSVDTVARIVADGLSKEMGQTVIVENKTGATGIVAAQAVAQSRPDGYTLLLVPGGHALYGATFKTLPFDPVDGFTWVTNIVTTPFFFAVPAQSPLQSMADIVAKGKAAPGAVKFGSVGPGSPHHLGVELLGLTTGTKFVHAAYRGEGPMIQALQGGEIDFAMFTPIQVLGTVQAGTMRALAATTNIRSSRLPNVPTVEQALNIKDYNIGSWFALAGPAGMPQPVVNRLNAALQQALKADDLLRRLAPVGGELTPTTPAEQRDRVARELATWTRLVNVAGVEKQ